MRGGMGQHTIRVHGLSVRRADTEDGSNQDILERRYEEESSIFVIDGLELFIVDRRLSVPAGRRGESRAAPITSR
jgi:hypothetical protein